MLTSTTSAYIAKKECKEKTTKHIHSKDQKDIDFEQIFLEICF